MSIFHKLVARIDKFVKRKRKPAELFNGTKEGIPYEEIRDDLESLDLVCFRGGDFVADAITYLTKLKGARKSKAKFIIPADSFSHVGIIVKSDILDDPRLEPGVPYIFESTMSGSLTDGVYNIDGEAYLGVQLRNFDEVIAGYDAHPDTRVAIAKLDRTILNEFYDEEELRGVFTEIFHQYNAIPYDFNPISLAGSIFKWLRVWRRHAEETADSSDWLFCSELVATVYRELELIPDNVDPSDVVPMDFFGYDADEHGVPCLVSEPQYITAYPE